MKTTFRRQLTLIICILLAATVMIGVAFRALFNRYAAQERESSLTGA